MRVLFEFTDGGKHRLIRTEQGWLVLEQEVQPDLWEKVLLERVAVIRVCEALLIDRMKLESEVTKLKREKLEVLTEQARMR